MAMKDCTLVAGMIFDSGTRNLGSRFKTSSADFQLQGEGSALRGLRALHRRSHPRSIRLACSLSNRALESGLLVGVGEPQPAGLLVRLRAVASVSVAGPAPDGLPKSRAPWQVRGHAGRLAGRYGGLVQASRRSAPARPWSLPSGGGRTRPLQRPFCIDPRIRRARCAPTAGNTAARH